MGMMSAFKRHTSERRTSGNILRITFPNGCKELDVPSVDNQFSYLCKLSLTLGGEKFINVIFT
jgi:hypothetical protein